MPPGHLDPCGVGQLVVQAVETVAKVLRKGQLVVLESTTYPGTTTELVQPVLEAAGFTDVQVVAEHSYAGGTSSSADSLERDAFDAVVSVSVRARKALAPESQTAYPEVRRA